MANFDMTGLIVDVLNKLMSIIKFIENDFFFVKVSSGHFLQHGKVILNPKPLTSPYPDWLVVYFMVLSFFIVVIWHYFPERFYKLVFSENSPVVKRFGSSRFTNPGILTYLLLLLTLLSSTTVTLVFIFDYFFGDKFLKGLDFYYMLGLFAGVVSVYYILRVILIVWIGFIFDTKEISGDILKRFLRLDIIQAVVLIPVIFIIFYSNTIFTVMTAALIISAVIVAKWFQIFFVGKNSSNVLVYHNILYLCTLEILPVYLMLKVAEIVGLPVI